MQKNTDRLKEEMLPSPVESIIGVWRFSSLLKTSRLRRSLPGHMIHLILDGVFVLNIQGRTFSVTPGDLVYYYESEPMEWQANQKKAVMFYSVGFIAPDLPPLPLEQRIFKSTETIQGLFRDLYEAYGLLDAPQRTIRLHALLQFSKMNVSETATFLGYPRPHEFSREFANYFGTPPSRIATMEI